MAFLKHKRFINPLLFVILILATFVRIWGIDFGLPYDMARPDEPYVVSIALSFARGSFNPQSFIYPTLYMYLLFFLYVIYFGLGLVRGTYTSIEDIGLQFRLDPTHFYLIDRMFSAFFGVATIFVVYKVAKRLFDRRVALISSFFLSFSYLHVRESHFGTVDVAVTFFLLLAVLSIVNSLKRSSERNSILAGLFAGLAAATKYLGVLLILPMAIIRFNRLRKSRKGILSVIGDRHLWLFGLIFLLAFIIGTPYAVLDWRTFLSDFVTNSRNLNVLWGGVYLGKGWLYHPRFTLFYGLGWSLFAASLLGIILLLRRAKFEALVLFSFPLAYFLLIGKGNAVFLRYMIPVIPFLCISGAVFTAQVSDWLRQVLRPRAVWFIDAILALLIVLPSLINIVHFDRLLAKTDSRLLARAWVYSQAQSGNSIYQTAANSFALRPTLETAEKQYLKLLAIGLGEDTLRARILYRELAVRREENLGGFDSWIWDEASQQFLFEGEIQEEFPDYIIAETSALTGYSRISQGISELLGASYDLVESFEVVDTQDPLNLYDQQDRFYLPFTGFSNVERPGPNIFVYQRIED